MDIVDETYEIPPELDEATKFILQEIGEMGKKTKLCDGHEIIIATEDFQTFWKRVSEWTTSSPSPIHYGHYKAVVKSEILSKNTAQQLTVRARSDVAPLR